MEKPLTERGMLWEEDQELVCGRAEFAAPICHPVAMGMDGWRLTSRVGGRCPGWRDPFGNHQYLSEDKNPVFGTFVPSLPLTQVLGSVQGTLK